jgi:uncharacterized protein (DUF1778 family)
MSDRQSREQISTRVARDAYEVIERAAEARRTTPSHVARVLLEDGARALAQSEERAA